MDSNHVDQMRSKSKAVRRGICQKCKVNPSTSRVQVRADEKYGDAKAEPGATTRGQQKFRLITAKATTLCDACCVTVFSAVVDAIDESIEQG